MRGAAHRGPRDEARADELALAVMAVAQGENGAQSVLPGGGEGAGRVHSRMIGITSVGLKPAYTQREVGEAPPGRLP